jgi:iron complex outermembrane receptor protein
VGGLTDIALNSPHARESAGVVFSSEHTSAGAVVRHVTAFPMNSGVYIGRVEPYTVADVQAAYQPAARDITISLSIQNLLDTRHREFVGAPVLGRFVMLQAEYTLH